MENEIKRGRPKKGQEKNGKKEYGFRGKLTPPHLFNFLTDHRTKNTIGINEKDAIELSISSIRDAMERKRLRDGGLMKRLPKEGKDSYW